MKTRKQLNELNNNFKSETQFKLIIKCSDYKSQSPTTSRNTQYSIT